MTYIAGVTISLSLSFSLSISLPTLSKAGGPLPAPPPVGSNPKDQYNYSKERNMIGGGESRKQGAKDEEEAGG